MVGRRHKTRPALGQRAASIGPLAALPPPALQAQRKVCVLPANAAFAQQHGNIGGGLRQPHFGCAHQHMRDTRAERQFRQRLAMRRDPTVAIQRLQRGQPCPRLGDGCGGRGIEPAQRPRIAHAPQCAVEQQAGKVAFQYLRRIEGGHASARGCFPQAIGDAGPLPRGAARTLGRRRLACPFGHQPGDARRPVITGPPRQPAVDDDPHTVDGQAGFRDAGRQYDLARARPRWPDCGPLCGGIKRSVEEMHVIGAAVDPLRRAFNLSHARQEGEQVAFRFLADGAADGGGHLILDPSFHMAADMTQFERLDAALALDHRCVAQQGGEARAVEGCGHGHDAQVRAQRLLRVERQREAEIAVQTALMHFVEQHRRHARQFGVVLNPADENALCQHQQTGTRRHFAVHPRGIADRAARLFAQHFGDPFGSGAGGETAGGKQQDLPAAPWFVQQRGCDRRRLASPRRRDQHGVAAGAQRSEQVGQDGMDGQGAHGPSSRPIDAKSQAERKLRGEGKISCFRRLRDRQKL